VDIEDPLVSNGVTHEWQVLLAEYSLVAEESKLRADDIPSIDSIFLFKACLMSLGNALADTFANQAADGHPPDKT
jgi:hypothetical protein